MLILILITLCVVFLTIFLRKKDTLGKICIILSLFLFICISIAGAKLGYTTTSFASIGGHESSTIYGIDAAEIYLIIFSPIILLPIIIYVIISIVKIKKSNIQSYE